MNKHHLDHLVNKITPIKEQRNLMASTFSFVKNSTWFTTTTNRLLFLTSKQSQQDKIKKNWVLKEKKMRTYRISIKMEIIQWRLRKKTKSVFAFFINFMEKRTDPIKIGTQFPSFPLPPWGDGLHRAIADWAGQVKAKKWSSPAGQVRTAKLFW